MININCNGVRKPVSDAVFNSATKVALQIARDLGMISAGRCTFSWAAFRAEQSGGNWHWRPAEDMPSPGQCGYSSSHDDTYPEHGRIYLSDALSKREAAPVFFHELAHRFMLSERYAELWEPCWESVEPLVFHEIVASCVGLMCDYLRSH